MFLLFFALMPSGIQENISIFTFLLSKKIALYISLTYLVHFMDLNFV